jgi:hypothetical protein
MGTHVLAGRGIDTNDREGSALVTVVSQQFARQVFKDRNPIGEWISVDGKMRQVVGVAEDGPTESDLHESPAPYLYLPFVQAPSWDVTLMAETVGDPGTLGRTIQKELKRFDPAVAIYSSTTLRQFMDQARAPDRFMAGIATGLGVFGFLLTTAGLFGVIQYAVNRRTRELGLRMALGAWPAEIQRMVLAQSLKMAACGIPIGLLLTGLAAHFVRSVLLGVTPLEPLTYVVSAALAVALALVAAWLPAARAARVDPVVALRSE